MANVKSRPKAPKSASTKSKVCKLKHTSTGNRNTGKTGERKANSLKETVHNVSPNDLGRPKARSNLPKINKIDKGITNVIKEKSTGDRNAEKSVMKKDCNSKSMPPEVKTLNTCLPPNDLNKNGNRNDRPKERNKIRKDILTLNKESLLMTRSGRIKKKTKDNLKFLDNILKSELLIHEKSKKTKLGHTSSNNHNNNDNEINNQNKPDKNSTSSSINTPHNNTTKLLDFNKKNESDKNEKQNENDSENNLKTVTQSNGVSGPVYQCHYCDKTFNTKKAVCRHIHAHLHQKFYKCTHCSSRFSHKANMKSHVRKYHTDQSKKKSYMCLICQKTFEVKQSLVCHLDAHMKNESFNICIFCHSKFCDNETLISHEKQHLASGHFDCSLCKLRCVSGTQLAKHNKTHLRARGHICQHCGKEYTELSSMRRHLQVAHTGMRIQCPVCNKKLRGHLSEHMRTHEQDRPHECSECGQRFTQSTQLNVHRRCHTGARPYVCKICQQCFSHSNALMLHIRRHTGEKPFSCAMCPLSFSQLPHMKAHMRNIHGKENSYKCLKCGQFYKLKVHLENHAKLCTVGDRELSFEEQIEASIKYEEIDSVMNVSRMRFLLALLLTMIASQDKLKYLGFNKRLIDDILVESLEAMGEVPCKDVSQSPVRRLKTNIEVLLVATIPKDEMAKFRRENKSTEELLEILTDSKKNYVKTKTQ